MAITINTGAALDDAKQIDQIIANIKDALKKLDDEINAIVASDTATKNEDSGIQVEWGVEFKQNWQSYHSKNIPETLELMGQSAANLRLAVEKTLEYSNNI